MNSYKYYYCKSWFLAKKVPIKPWAEERAKKASLNGDEYTVLVNDPENPEAVIVMAGLNNFVALDILDENLRVIKAIQFHEHGPDNQFLAVITNREYKGETDEITSAISYNYKKNGIRFVERRKFNPAASNFEESKISLDGNFFERPKFGSYDHLLDIDFSIYEK